MKKLLLILLLVYAAYVAQKGEADIPPLQDGDIVFQTTWTNQALATAVASSSVYLHTGIVEMTPEGTKVVEASKVVREQPLHLWIERGIGKRFAIYRYKGLTQQQREAITQAARSYDGTPYDFYFTLGDGGVYCSSLDYLAFKGAGIELGHFERIGDLHINNRFVRDLIEQRWRGYPQCKSKDITFDQCYDLIMDGTLLTPASIAADSHVERIFSNYW